MTARPRSAAAASTPISSCTSSRRRFSIARRCRCRHRGRRLRDARACTWIVHGDTAHAGATPMDDAAQRAGRRRHAGGRRQRHRLAATHADRGQGHGGPHGGLAQQGRHPLRVRAAHAATSGTPSARWPTAMCAEVKAAMPECARRANVEMRIAGELAVRQRALRSRLHRPHPRGRRGAEGLPHRDILSQAGHDAYYISRIAPTAMIFTPCRDGVSHNEAEHAELDYTVARRQRPPARRARSRQPLTVHTEHEPPRFTRSGRTVAWARRHGEPSSPLCAPGPASEPPTFRQPAP